MNCPGADEFKAFVGQPPLHRFDFPGFDHPAVVVYEDPAKVEDAMVGDDARGLVLAGGTAGASAAVSSGGARSGGGPGVPKKASDAPTRANRTANA
jgi:hypothetical protein